MDTLFRISLLAVLNFLAWGVCWSFPSDVFVEAEDGAIASPEVAVVEETIGASGGVAVQVGVREQAKVQPAADSPAELRIAAEIPFSGHVSVWGRILARSGGSDSFWLALDDGDYQMVSPQASAEWRWHRLGHLRLRQGREVTLRIRHRETGLLLDRLVLTSRVRARPTGMGEMAHMPVTSPYPAPPVTPPAEHPRVFLRRSFLPVLRERLKHPSLAPAVEQLHQNAGQPGDGVLSEPEDPDDSNYSQRVLRTIDANALLYLLEGDAAKGRRALQMIEAFNDSVIFPSRHDVTRDYARTILTTALVYDWCYDLADAAWRSRHIESILRLASMMEIGYPPVRQSAITSHGGEAQLLRALLSAGVAVYDEFPEIYNVSAGRFFAEFVPARNFFFQAHWHHQGDSYGWYRFRWSLFAAYLFERLGAGSVFTADQGQVPYSWIYMRRPDGQLLRDGDTFSRGEYWSFPLVAMMTASMYRDPYIHAEYQRQCEIRPSIRRSFWNLLFYDPTVPLEPIEDLAYTRYFPEPMGIMIARTGWQMGAWSPTVVAEMKGAGFHFNNHDHLDAGSFQIYYKGALATDAGSYGHYGIPYDYAWNKRSVSHNTLLIYDPENPPDPRSHDGGQNFPNSRREPPNLEVLFENDYRNGAVLSHAFGPDSEHPFYSHLKADLTPGYRDRAHQVQRSFVFLNVPGERPAAMVVLDRIRVRDDALKPFWLLHSVEKPVLSENRIDIRRTADGCNGRLLATTLLPRQPVYELIGGPGRESEVFGRNFEADRPTEESQGWRVQIAGDGQASPAAFLNVLQVLDADSEVQPAVAQVEQLGDLLAVKVGENVVGFSSDDSPIDSSCSLPIGGGPATHVVLTDLAPGVWSVTQDGRLLGTAQVKEGNGTLSFRATGRRIEFQPTGAQTPMRQLPAVPTPEAAEGGGISLIIDGRRVALHEGQKIRSRDGAVWVPIAAAAARVGFDVMLRDGVLTLRRQEERVDLQTGESSVSFNGTDVALDHPLRSENGDLLAAHSDLAAILHVKSSFETLSNAVIIRTLPENQLWTAGTRASAEEAGRGPGMSIDGDMQTYWAAAGDGQWIVYDLGSMQSLRAVDIAWLHSDERRQRFDVQLSTDGTSWKTVFSGSSSGQVDGFEAVTFPAQPACYVRIVGHENSKNHWNSIREVIIRPAR